MHVCVFAHADQIGYRDKAREEASRGGSLAHRPDIALATEVSKLTSQVRQNPTAEPSATLETRGQLSYVFVPKGPQEIKTSRSGPWLRADPAD